MRRIAALILAGAATPLLSGCVAAALPLVAAGAMARQEVTGPRDRAQQPEPMGEPRPEVPRAAAPAPGFSTAIVPSISPVQPPADSRHATPRAADHLTAPAHDAAADPGDLPIEAALAAIRDRLPIYAPAQAGPYDDFIRFALQQADRREEGRLTQTVMLSGPPLDGVMQLLPCGFLPPAVILDLDDGVGDGLSLASVDPSQPVVAATGLAAGLEQLRQRDIAIIWMTSQPFDRFDAIAALLRNSGLDSGGRDTIVLTRTVSERKQERRKDTAASHCVLAIAGDRKGDFDELYDYLRNPDLPIESDRMIDTGWFIAPQPLSDPSRRALSQP